MFAAFAVVMLALTSWLGAAHDATTIHVLCPQHGELMDDAAALPSAGARTATAPAHCISAAGNSARGHEHCTISAATRASRIAASSPVLAASPVVLAVRDIATRPVAVSIERDRYRTAPKTSPPV